MSRSFALALAVLAVMIGIMLGTEARLNHNEPHCRFFTRTANGCAEHGEPILPGFLRAAPPQR